MLVLLPPSEGKARPARGRPADLTSLSFPSLTPARREVLAALAAASAAPGGARTLGVGEGLASEVAANTRLGGAPAVAVRDLYTGVLYEALDLPGLDAAARRRAATRVVVVSAAHGLLRPGDRVAPYRLSMDVDLPGVGRLAAYWRPHLREVLDDLAGTGLVVDCRSAAYAAVWSPGAQTARHTVAVRVVREAGGARAVVSHLAKHTRGLLARHLLSRGGRDPRTPEALHDAAAEAFTAELAPPTRPGATGTLTLVVAGSYGRCCCQGAG